MEFRRLFVGPDNCRPLSCCLDEPNGLRYVTTDKEIHAASVHTAGEKCAARIFPLVRVWALAQPDRAAITPAPGIIAIGEVNMRAMLPSLMRIRVVGVLGLVLRFAFE